jgi:hypothetical protein
MEETKQQVLLIGLPDDVAAMSAAVARLATALDIVFVTQLEAQAIEASELPTGCSNTCPELEQLPCYAGDGCFSGYGNYYLVELSVERAVACALEARPRWVSYPVATKTIGTPYRGYASTYRRHRR